MKKIICILITLSILLIFASCSATDAESTEEAASASAGQSASETASDDVEAAAQVMAEYQTDYGTISYPADYQEAYEISEHDEGDDHMIVFETTLDGTDYNLFNLVLTEEETEWLLKDEKGNAHYVEVQLNEINTDALTQEQQDRLFALQEGVNVILENMHS